MIRLKELLLEGKSNADEKANAIAKLKLGNAYNVISKQTNPEKPGEIVFTVSDGVHTNYIRKGVTDSYTGLSIWSLKNNDEWEPISVKSLSKMLQSPEAMTNFWAAQEKRKRDEEERWARWQAEREQEKLEQTRYLNAKFPNFTADWNSNTTGNENFDQVIRTLDSREQKVVFMRHKGYTNKDLSEMFNVSPPRIEQIYRRAIKQLQHVVNKLKLELK